jgi:hypothetical protein
MRGHLTSLLAFAGLLGSTSLATSALQADEVQSAKKTTQVTEARAVDFSLSDLSAYAASAETDVTSTYITDSTFGPTSEPCGCGKAANCDCKKMKELEAKAAGAYKGLFYDNNFDYLCDPCYDDWHLGERLKRNCIGDWGILDIGGQFRMRQQSERNHRGLGLTGRDDDFLLYRTRLYANLEVGQRFRAYAEYIDAQSEFEDFPPRPIEVNRSDFLNLFGDLMLLDGDRGQLWARVGRQELLYGEQRLITTLDWANTRLTFEGVKLFWEGEAWNADFFYTRPVLPNATRFDSPIYDREFMGAYLTYKKLKNSKLDLFYLISNNSVDGGGDFNNDTVGARFKGGSGVWLWDAEGGYQGGNFQHENHDAGFYTLGLGRKFECVRWTPTIWAYYDWASGDDIIGNAFDQLYPLAHKYLGFMDLFARRNIEDWNFLLTMTPHERVKLLLWYHIFHLEDINDVPYNVNGTPFNPANLPASTDLGKEIDATITFKLTPRAGLLFGYSHFFAGDYYFQTPGTPYAGDANFFYTQFHLNF